MHEDRIHKSGTSEASDMRKQRSPCCQADLHWIRRPRFTPYRAVFTWFRKATRDTAVSALSASVSIRQERR